MALHEVKYGVIKILSNLVANSFNNYTDKDILELKTRAKLLGSDFVNLDMSDLFDEFGVYYADLLISEDNYSPLGEIYSLYSTPFNKCYSDEVKMTFPDTVKKIRLDVTLHVDFKFILYALFLMKEFSKFTYNNTSDTYKITSYILRPSNRFIINIDEIVLDSIQDEDISKFNFKDLENIPHLRLNLDIDKKVVFMDMKEIVEGFVTPVSLKKYIPLLGINGRVGHKNILFPIHLGLDAEESAHIVMRLIECLDKLSDKDDEHLWITIDSDEFGSGEIVSPRFLYELFEDSLEYIKNQNFHLCLLSYKGNNLFLTDDYMIKLSKILDNTLFIRRLSDLENYIK